MKSGFVFFVFRKFFYLYREDVLPIFPILIGHLFFPQKLASIPEIVADRAESGISPYGSFVKSPISLAAP